MVYIIYHIICMGLSSQQLTFSWGANKQFTGCILTEKKHAFVEALYGIRKQMEVLKMISSLYSIGFFSRLLKHMQVPFKKRHVCSDQSMVNYITDMKTALKTQFFSTFRLYCQNSKNRYRYFGILVCIMGKTWCLIHISKSLKVIQKNSTCTIFA